MPKRLDDPIVKRVVFDTNTWVSGTFFADSVPGRALEKARDEAVVLASEETLAELGGVFTRTKFDKYASLPNRLAVLRDIRSASLLIDVSHKVDVCRDPKDDQFLSLALAGNAHLLITGDQDLLIIGSFGKTRIIPAREYLDQT